MFALHFGNYGGDAIRWGYFLLGLAGAGLFYTGNLLWVESRRRKERKGGLPEQTRATRVLGALTVGLRMGCVAGISRTVAAAKLFGTAATPGSHATIYYAVFLAFAAYALVRSAARAAVKLAAAAALLTLAVPVAGIWTTDAWYRSEEQLLAAIVALGLATALAIAAKSAHRRIHVGPRDSIWAVQKMSNDI